jgi:hypothetical protein
MTERAPGRGHCCLSSIGEAARPPTAVSDSNDAVAVGDRLASASGDVQAPESATREFGSRARPSSSGCRTT